MASLNQHILIGNLGADPDIRQTQDGRKIANFSIATSESWKDKNTGEKREITDWHRVVVFGPAAEIVEKYVNKGDQITIMGKVKTRKWQDQSGADRYSTETVVQGYSDRVILLGGRSGNGGEDRANQQDQAYSQGGGGGGGGAGPDDEIPF